MIVDDALSAAVHDVFIIFFRKQGNICNCIHVDHWHSSHWSACMGDHNRSIEMHSVLQEALEVWDYSSHHLSLFAASPEFRGRPIRFRYVPCSWFPVVSSHLFAYKSSSLYVILRTLVLLSFRTTLLNLYSCWYHSHSDCNVALDWPVQAPRQRNDTFQTSSVQITIWLAICLYISAHVQ